MIKASKLSKQQRRTDHDVTTPSKTSAGVLWQSIKAIGPWYGHHGRLFLAILISRVTETASGAEMSDAAQTTMTTAAVRVIIKDGDARMKHGLVFGRIRKARKTRDRWIPLVRAPPWSLRFRFWLPSDGLPRSDAATTMASHAEKARPDATIKHRLVVRSCSNVK
jgi:hypothetical protein